MFGGVIDKAWIRALNMALSRCKLSKRMQLRPVEFFVLEVAARSAADVLGRLPNTAVLFYRKLRRCIADHAQIHGIPRDSFPLFLKECEFRFNYGTHRQQLKTLRERAGI